MVARETPDAAATSSTVVFAIPRRAMHRYAPSRTRRRTSVTRRRCPWSEVEERVEPDGETGTVADRLYRPHHSGHERRAVVGVVPDRERLPDGAEQHLLVGHEPAQAHRVHVDPCGAHSPA